MGVGQVLGEQPGVLRGAGGTEPGGAEQPPRGQDQGDHQDQAGNYKVSILLLSHRFSFRIAFVKMKLYVGLYLNLSFNFREVQILRVKRSSTGAF